MLDFATGIDDIATMNAKCSGWTIVSIDLSMLGSFEQKAAQILREARLSSFHGKVFKRRKRNSYVQFLRLIRSTLESSSGFVCCTLLGQDWKSEFQNFCDNVIGNSFANAGVDSKEIIEASKRIVAPLFTYQKVAAERCQGGSTLIHIDRHAVLDQLISSDLLVEGKQISSQLPIVAALREYGRMRFPSSPEVERESIIICPDEDSFLVQAADIIGNFATAFAYRQLGKNSESNNLKCSIFEEVFGDIIDISTFPDSVMLDGDDLVLDGGAASFTFYIGGLSHN